MSFIYYVCLLICIIFSSLSFALPIKTIATVTKVVDGDTVDALYSDDTNESPIRLVGVDTPESVGQYVKNYKQPGGKEVSAWLKNLLLNKEIVFLDLDQDANSRVLAIIWLKDNSNLTYYSELSGFRKNSINSMLVKQGIAYRYSGKAPIPSKCNTNACKKNYEAYLEHLSNFQKSAEKNKLGLFGIAEKYQHDPRIWRKMLKNIHSKKTIKNLAKDWCLKV